MAQIYWTGGNGSWGTASDWSTGSLPTANDAVTIAAPGVTVSIGKSVSAAAYTLTVLGSTINLDGGSLYTVAGGNFQGVFDESAGTYSMTGVGAVFGNQLDQSGGTLDAISGAITLNGGGSLAGTVTGYGTLAISQGTTYFQSGFSTSINSIVVGGSGLLGIDTNVVSSHNFTEEAGGTVDLFGHTLTLGGHSQIDGILGNGRVTFTGTGSLGSEYSGSTVLDNGLIFVIKGTETQEGNISAGAGDAGAKIEVVKGGTYDIAGNWSIYDPSSIGSFTNAGLLEKLGGGKTAVIDTSFSNTGTIDVGIGALELNGLVNAVSGKVGGSGTLTIAGGQTTLSKSVSLTTGGLLQQSGQLVINSALSYGGEWDQTGGVLNLNAATARVTLSGPADFDGGLISGYGGTLTLNGPAQFGDDTIGGPNVIDVNGAVHQTNTITLGLSSNPVVNIAAGASWLMEGNGNANDNNIDGTYGLINNAGTFGIVNTSGQSDVFSQIVNTGTLSVGNGILALYGLDTIGGVVTGGGQLVLSGTDVLQAGVTLGVASLDITGSVYTGASLSYANAFAQGGGYLALAGTLSLTGRATLDSGTLTAGVLNMNGAATVYYYAVDSGAVLGIGGAAEQAGPNSQLADYGEVSIASGASYTIDDDLGIGGSGSLYDAGTLTASATGTSAINPYVNLTGALAVNDQEVVLTNGASLAGTVSGAGTLELTNSSSSDTYVMAAGLALNSAGLLLYNATESLAANFSYAGSLTQANSTVVQLNGFTETLSGTASLLGGAFEGPGTLAVSGSGTLANIAVLGGAVLNITGAAEQTGAVQVGAGSAGNQPPDSSVLAIAKGATDTLEAYGSINGNGTLSVAGTLIAAGNSAIQIGPTLVDAGTIAANLGTLSVLSAISGAGNFTIGTAGVLDFSNSSTITASNTISFTAGGGELKLDNLQSFNADLAGFATKDIIVLSQINPSSISLTYGATHDQLLVTDGSGNSITLDFTTAQTLTSITTGTVGGLAALIHN